MCICLCSMNPAALYPHYLARSILVDSAAFSFYFHSIFYYYFSNILSGFFFIPCLVRSSIYICMCVGIVSRYRFYRAYSSSRLLDNLSILFALLRVVIFFPTFWTNALRTCRISAFVCKREKKIFFSSLFFVARHDLLTFSRFFVLFFWGYVVDAHSTPPPSSCCSIEKMGGL